MTTSTATTQHVCNSVGVLDASGPGRPGQITLEMHGELDHPCPVALEHILGVISDLRPERLTLDLAGVTYLNAQGLRVLAQADRAVGERGVHLLLTCPPGMTARLLSIARFGHVVTDRAVAAPPGDVVFTTPARTPMPRSASAPVHRRGTAGLSSAATRRPVQAPDAGIALAHHADRRLQALRDLEDELGRSGEGPEAIREAILTSVVGSLPGVEGGGIVEAAPRTGLGTSTTNGALATVVHGAQMDSRQGPSWDAQRTGTAILVEDVSTDARWPEFRYAMVGVLVRSVLCIPLTSAGRVLGVLSLHSQHPRGFPAWEREAAADLAIRGAGAMKEAQLRAGLQTALASRDLIGQAKGILMGRHLITAEQAYDLLSRTSQQHNVRVVVLAEDLTRTGILATDVHERQPQPPPVRTTRPGAR